ncbi:MAG: glycosyltransferase [Pyrinomonadaceae bacterium]
MHLTDTLDAGGRERVAVDLVNVLQRERYQTHLCTTRREGPLADLVAEDVGRLRLTRKGRFDPRAIQQLIAYIRKHQVHILHAHETTLFLAAVASLFPPHPAVIWHDHFGGQEMGERPAPLYRQAAKRVSGVIVVNQSLADWSLHRLHVPADRVWFIPNFVIEPKNNEVLHALPGKAGGRIVCVANFRPQKDHRTLLHAMGLVIQQERDAHLLLVGAGSDQNYLELVQKDIARHELGGHVSLLGQRRDIPALLRACDIGVLSSASEGLPLALLEYGMAGLPAVVTRVGQCAEVLEEGGAGILVPPAAPDELAAALVSLLRLPERRASLGEKLHRRVQEVYSPGPVIEKISRVYDAVINSPEGQLPDTTHSTQPLF